jgi:outer membrane protein assembly factor BamB
MVADTAATLCMRAQSVPLRQLPVRTVRSSAGSGRHANTRALCAAVLLLPVLASAQSWPGAWANARGDASLSGRAPTSVTQWPLAPRWSVPIGNLSQVPAISPVIAPDGTIMMVMANHQLAVLSPDGALLHAANYSAWVPGLTCVRSTGTQNWGTPAISLALDTSHVYLSCGELLAFDTDYFSVAFATQLQDGWGGSPLTIVGTDASGNGSAWQPCGVNVLAPTCSPQESSLYNPSTGAWMESFYSSFAAASDAAGWLYGHSYGVNSDSDVVFAIPQACHQSGPDDDGMFAWQVKLGGGHSPYNPNSATQPPLPVLTPAGDLVVVSMNQSFAASLNASNGGVRWRVNAPQSMSLPCSLAVAADGTVYMLATPQAGGQQQQRLIAVNSATGSVKWNIVLPLSATVTALCDPVIAGDGTVFTPLSNGSILTVSADSYTITANTSVPGVSTPFGALALAADGTLLAVNRAAQILQAFGAPPPAPGPSPSPSPHGSPSPAPVLPQPWSQFQGSAQHTGLVPAAPASPSPVPAGRLSQSHPQPQPQAAPAAEPVGYPTVAWAVHLQGPLASSPVVGPDGAVYIGTGSGGGSALPQVAAFTWDGRPKWATADAAGMDVQSALAVAPAGGAVYAWLVNGTLVALDAARGDVMWSLPLDGGDGSPLASPAVGNDTVYLHAGASLVAVAANATVQWTAQLGSPATSSSPTLSADGSTVYVGSGTSVYAFDAASGTPVWTISVHSPVESTPALGTLPASATGSGSGSGSGGTQVLYVGTDDGSMHFIDAASGVELGRYMPGNGAAFSATAALSANGTLVLPAADGSLCVLDAATGDVVWCIPGSGTGVKAATAAALVPSATLDSGGNVFVGGTSISDGALVRLTPDGANVWTFQAGPVSTSPAWGYSSYMYVAATNGTLFAFANTL